ncbi:MAG: thioredoxin domain-containing protein [Planctomycetes bacterium]|nr:thioredoxin domain-containing protein [Planctomycetota bacterium]
MNQNRYWAPLMVAVIGGLLLVTSASAQTGSAAAVQSDPQEDQAAIRAQLDEVQSELKAIRADLKKVLVQLAAVKAAQTKPKPKTRQPDTTVYNIDLGESPIRGPKDAPVTIVEYASFACGFCTREAPVIKKVMDAYPDKVRFVFKQYPMWPKARASHAAMVWAQKQKGDEAYWKMHDLIHAGGTRKLAAADLRVYAEQIGLDLAAFDAMMADQKQVDALSLIDTPTARNYKVTGTPAVFVNGLRLSPRRFEDYKARIEDILKAKTPTKAKGG